MQKWYLITFEMIFESSKFSYSQLPYLIFSRLSLEESLKLIKAYCDAKGVLYAICGFKHAQVTNIQTTDEAIHLLDPTLRNALGIHLIEEVQNYLEN